MFICFYVFLVYAMYVYRNKEDKEDKEDVYTINTTKSKSQSSKLFENDELNYKLLTLPAECSASSPGRSRRKKMQNRWNLCLSEPKRISR